MVNPARTRRGSTTPESPPMFCTATPRAKRSQTANAAPTSPGHSPSAGVPGPWAYFPVTPKASSPRRYTRDVATTASSRLSGPGVESTCAPAPQSNRESLSATAPSERAEPPGIDAYEASTAMCRIVARPAGFAKITDASPTSAAPAPPNPTERTEAGSPSSDGDCPHAIEVAKHPRTDRTRAPRFMYRGPLRPALGRPGAEVAFPAGAPRLHRGPV